MRARPPDRAPTGDRGETLLELLVAVTIMGIAVVAIVAGIGTSILLSDVHRKQATAGWAARDYAEAITHAGFHSCANPAYYQTAAGYTAPSGYDATVLSVTNWTGTSWGATCAGAVLQQVTVQVASHDGRVSERLVFVMRG
jgi:Tfp pilus assembly protein PilV